MWIQKTSESGFNSGSETLEIPVPIVVDPNTLNLDPDPEFWPNFDSDSGPDPGLGYQF